MTGHTGLGMIYFLVILLSFLQTAQGIIEEYLVYPLNPSNNRQNKSVLLYPKASIEEFPVQAPRQPGWAQIYDIMQQLFEEDVVIVTCAGENGGRFPGRGDPALTRYPTIWTSDAFPLVVAGAVTYSGY